MRTSELAQYGRPRFDPGNASAEVEVTATQHPASVFNGVTEVTIRNRYKELTEKLNLRVML